MAQSSAGIGYAPRRGHPRCAVPWVLSPHPSPLPWGEGEPFSPRRTIQTHRLTTARCALSPLPEGEGQGEGKRRELPSRVWDHSSDCRTGRVLPRSRRFPKITMTNYRAQNEQTGRVDASACSNGNFGFRIPRRKFLSTAALGTASLTLPSVAALEPAARPALI